MCFFLLFLAKKTLLKLSKLPKDVNAYGHLLVFSWKDLTNFGGGGQVLGKVLVQTYPQAPGNQFSSWDSRGCRSCSWGDCWMHNSSSKSLSESLWDDGECFSSSLNWCCSSIFHPQLLFGNEPDPLDVSGLSICSCFLPLLTSSSFPASSFWCVYVPSYNWTIKCSRILLQSF